MDIGAMGGFQGITPLTGGGDVRKMEMPKLEPSPLTISDGLAGGVYTGSEIIDPRSVFQGNILKEKEPTLLPGAEFTGDGKTGVFEKPEMTGKVEIPAYEGFYLAGGMQNDPSLNGLFLNGPSSSQKGIVSLSGQTLGNNPQYLSME